MNTASTKTKVAYVTDKYGFLKQENPQPFDYTLDYKAKQSTTTEMAWLRMSWLSSYVLPGELRNFNVVDIGAGSNVFVNEGKHIFRRIVPYDLVGDSIDDVELYSTCWDMVTLFDVLEHYPDIDQFWALQFRYALISYPETPKDYPLEKWRHYKPNEHIYCLDKDNIINWAHTHDCAVIAQGCPEDRIRTRWDPKRVNITTILLKRNNETSQV